MHEKLRRILSITLCVIMLLGTVQPAFAVDEMNGEGIEFTVSLSHDEIAYSEMDQSVDMFVMASSPIELNYFEFFLSSYVGNNFQITSVSATDSQIALTPGVDYYSESGYVSWMGSVNQNNTMSTIAKVTLLIPGGTPADDYVVGVEEIVASRYAGSVVNVENGDAYATATLTITAPSSGDDEPGTTYPVNYTLAADFDDDTYMAGATATANIYLSSDIEAKVGAFEFELEVPNGLTLSTLTTALSGQSSVNAGKIAFNVSSDTALSISSTPVKIATATFSVADGVADSTKVELGISSSEITLVTDNVGYPAAVSSEEVTLHNHFAYTESAANATISGQTGLETIGSTNYAKYQTAISFTVAPSTGYVIDQVSYSVGGNDKGALTASNGTYTIPAADVTGAVVVTVTTKQYFTVTFAAGTGTDVTETTGYMYANDATIYGSHSATGLSGSFTAPIPTAQTGYRLADKTGENLWNLNAYGSGADFVPGTTTVAANTTVYAQAVKQWTVTFKPGANGTLNGTTSYTVDAGTEVSSLAAPEIVPNVGYVANGWSPALTGTVDSDKEFVAQYKDATYSLTLPAVENGTWTVTVNGEAISPTEGVYSITHGTDVAIKLSGTNLTITGITQTIGGSSETIFTGSATAYEWTITGDKIIGEVVIGVDSNKTYTITVVLPTEGEFAGKVSVANSSKTYNMGDKVDADDFKLTFESGYVLASDEGLSQIADTAVNETKTYTVTIKHGEYMVTSNGGDTLAMATHGANYTFTPKANNGLVTAVSAKIGDDEITVTDNGDGTYTIAGDAIIGNITLTYTVLPASSWEFITYSEYAALESGTVVAILNTNRVDGKGYTLKGLGAGSVDLNLFWSSKYNAYVTIVKGDISDMNDGVEERNATKIAKFEAELSAKLEATDTAAAELDYSGDINNSSTVTAADSAPINAVLHHITDVSYDITIQTRLESDVNGDKTVSTQDIMHVLDIASGKSTNS